MTGRVLAAAVRPGVVGTPSASGESKRLHDRLPRLVNSTGLRTLTCTDWPLMVTVTLSGTGTGTLPIRLSFATTWSCCRCVCCC